MGRLMLVKLSIFMCKHMSTHTWEAFFIRDSLASNDMQGLVLESADVFVACWDAFKCGLLSCGFLKSRLRRLVFLASP